MPECIPFEVRATFFQQMIKNDVAKNQHVAKNYVRIRRLNIFEDGFQAFSKVANLKTIVGVVFVSQLGMQEEGHDAGGLFKEFLVDLAKIVFNPQYGLFLATEKDGELYPNAQSHMLFSKNDVKYFQFLGRILGKAMYEGITLEPKFADFFLRKLIGKQNSLNDLKSLDPELFKNLSFLKNYDGDAEDLSLTFCLNDENEVTGERREVELIPGGAQMNVNNQNKFRYIYMMADFRLNRRIKSQSDAFVKGFHELIPQNWLSIFNEREVQMLISGASQRINVNELRKYSKYMGGYSSSDSKIKMFWKIVETEMNEDDQSKLLKFVTSCSREPLMGFQYMHPTFTISKMDTNQPDEKLPTASTCFNILRLPPYSNAKIMKEKILYAIHSNAGFEMA